ncbi:Uncharacterised protein [Shewanella putrefaciens]|nr:Uncharacterised protein [Shewanella putrefaciens]
MLKKQSIKLLCNYIDFKKEIFWLVSERRPAI